MVTVYIPTPFRRATAQRDRVESTAADVGAVLDDLERTYGGLKGLVRNEQGQVHAHVAIYVNGEAIDSLSGLATRLKDGDDQRQGDQGVHGGDGAEFLLQQPSRLIELMHAHVDEDAAALLAKRRTGRGSVPLVVRYQVHVAQVSGRDALAQVFQ